MDNITTTEILKQVERICSNSELKTKKLICSFLRFIVKETLEGRGDQLKGYTIGITVLGKKADFDPEQDSLVRIHAGRLRRLLRVYYLDSGKHDPIRIEIPKGAYQPFFKRNNEVQIKREIDSVPIIHEPLVAVLPFKNLTGDPNKEYFAYGFSEELSIELTKYDDLEIVNCWQRPETDIPGNLQSKIGARFFIDGSVQIFHHQIKILVKLIDLASWKQIWAERYAGDLSAKSLIVIQEEIADEVAKTIGSEVGIVLQQLTRESSHIKPQNLEVFDAILQFYYYENHMSDSLGIKTFQKLQHALSNDPSSGVIHAMISSMLGNAYALDYPNNDGAYEKMGDFAEKALSLDPDNLMVRIMYAFKCLLYNEGERFLQEVDHCLTMKIGSPFRLGIIGFHLSLFGQWERGKALLDKAMNRSIGYPLFLHGATSLYHYRQSKFEEAFNEAVKYDVPGLFWGPMLRAACLGMLNRKDEALSHIQNLKNLKPDFEAKATYLISRFVKQDVLVAQIMEGLVKAGMRL